MSIKFFHISCFTIKDCQPKRCESKNLASVKDYKENIGTKKEKLVFFIFLAKVLRILGPKGKILLIKVRESGETKYEVENKIKITDFYLNAGRYRSIVQIFSRHIKPPQLATKPVLHFELGTMLF